jgi:hypothetical protein
MEALAMIRQAFGEKSVRHTRKSKFTEPENSETVEEQSQEHAHHFLGITKKIILAGKTVNSEYYSDLLRQLRENVQKLQPELWRQNTWLLHHDNAPSHTSFFTRERLTKSIRLSSPTNPTFLCLFD